MQLFLSCFILGETKKMISAFSLKTIALLSREDRPQHEVKVWKWDTFPMPSYSLLLGRPIMKCVQEFVIN